MQLLKQKHPQASDAPEQLHEIRYENINAETVRKAVTKTRGGAEPSGMDADGWRRMIMSNKIGFSSNDLCKVIAEIIKKLCTKPNQSDSLEALLSSRLIPLDKYPGVGEVLR